MTRLTWGEKQVDYQLQQQTQYRICTLKQYRLRHSLLKGGWSVWLERLCVHRQPVVIVLPYDPNSDCFVLIKQMRVGALFGPETPWLQEVVAGIIDAGEVPVITAHRELLEETGLTCTRMTKLTAYWVSPGCSDEYAHVFMAIVDAAQAPLAGGVASEHEDIAISVHKRQAVYAHLDAGKYNNSALLIALLWFRQHEQLWVKTIQDAPQ